MLGEMDQLVKFFTFFKQTFCVLKFYLYKLLPDESDPNFKIISNYQFLLYLNKNIQ